jgi:hypothetical protein
LYRSFKSVGLSQALPAFEDSETTMAIPRLLVVALLLSIIPATVYAVVAANSEHSLADSTKLSSLSISASGNATAIGKDTTSHNPLDQVSRTLVTDASVSASQTIHSDLSLSAKAANQNDAVVQFNITSVTLKIGPTTYTGDKGTGIFNQHSLVVVVHATVSSSSGSGMLILIGHATASLTTSGTSTVTFSSPQSKLASSDFLSLKGTLTVS